ncbi:MAG: hypothetical protein U1E35_04290 [Rhodospirillales bacterium]
MTSPPGVGRYCYWTNPRTPREIGRMAGRHKPVEGFLVGGLGCLDRKHSGEDWVPAREPGGGGLEPLCDAPGTCVNARN